VVPHFLKDLTERKQNGCGYYNHSDIVLKLALQPAVPEMQGPKSGSLSRNSTTTILLSKLSKKALTTLRDEHFSVGQLDVFSVWSTSAFKF